MNRLDCENFAHAPETDPLHPEGCEECRKMVDAAETLDRVLSAERIAARPVPLALPRAPWEQSGHRAWGFVALCLAVTLGMGAALFAMSGISPIAGFVEAISSAIPAQSPLPLISRLSGALVQAPMSFHATVLAGFVIVNLLLALLLRRPTRGIDAPGR